MNGAADQRRGGGELAHQPNRPLHPLDGRREAPGRKRMAIRSADGAVDSNRVLGGQYDWLSTLVLKRAREGFLHGALGEYLFQQVLPPRWSCLHL